MMMTPKNSDPVFIALPASNGLVSQENRGKGTGLKA